MTEPTRCHNCGHPDTEHYDGGCEILIPQTGGCMCPEFTKATTFIEDVAQSVKTIPEVAHVGLAFPIDGPDQQSIVVNLADESLWVVEVSKVNPL